MMERGFLLHTMSLQSLSTVVAALEEHRKHLQVDSVELMEVCETTGIEKSPAAAAGQGMPRLIKSNAHCLSVSLPVSWDLLMWPLWMPGLALQTISGSK